MSSTLVKPTRRGTNPNRLTSMQLKFCAELLADEKMNGSSAAKKAGYSNPSVAAAKLLNNPLVNAVIGKALQERLEGCKLEATQVLKHLAAALYLDPLELFEKLPGNDGVYQIRDLESVPVHVRRCITKFKCKSKTYVVNDEEITESYVEVELMSKDAMMALAMKHLGLAGADGVNFNVNVNQTILVRLLDMVEGEAQAVKPIVVDAGYIERKAEEQ